MRLANILIFTLLVVTILIFGLNIIFGLAGSNAYYYLLIIIGYVLGIVSSFLGFFWKNFIYGSVLGTLMIISGFILDAIFWTNHNKNYCAELRAEPLCLESSGGFSCKEGSNFPGTVLLKCKD